MPPKKLRRAAYEERVAVSGLLNQYMVKLYDDCSPKTWRRLYEHMDDDFSGKVNYEELEDLIRNELHISTEALSREDLMAVFRALDADDSGLLTHNEFNDFLRCGTHVVTGAEAWIDREALVAEALRKQMTDRQETEKPSPRAFHERFRRGPPKESAAQQAATRVYNRGGVHIRSDPFVAAVDRKGQNFQKTRFHLVGQELVTPRGGPGGAALPVATTLTGAAPRLLAAA
eukprot:TRINITY_DN11602_c0_g1_i1.p1 TRINITY_DN11602_c0_g1~~TRINITY_DN11602_c0_g1_i1.p1  ORF type:complete len:230 (+),score=62.78 TRINITY_DN11602_c0_g1_i1:68-757(+)